MDYIVITESNVSTTGTAKRLHFWENRYRYEQYWPKIKYLVEWEGTHKHPFTTCSFPSEVRADYLGGDGDGLR